MTANIRERGCLSPLQESGDVAVERHAEAARGKATAMDWAFWAGKSPREGPPGSRGQADSARGRGRDEIPSREHTATAFR